MKTLHDLPAPAKLNLFLHVTGQRPDGYHLLQSVFVLIDWSDTISLEQRIDGLICREDLGPGMGQTLPHEDLCVRAAQALREACGVKRGVHIQIAKRIPAQAGMGGGSSDAATVLLGLNRLWDLHMPRSELERIGLQLGADVPFFLRGSNAWVEGIGESIAPLTLPSRRIAVLKPERGISTPAIFAHSALKRDTARATIDAFADRSDIDPFAFGTNDLQPVAELLEPQVTLALNMLRDQGLKPRMTGSGSAVFALLPEDHPLREPPAGWQQRACRTLLAHPLAGWAI